MTDQELVAIDDIDIGERDRIEMGDLDGLSESIEEVGLLHPVVITADRQLVAGGRRLECCRQLGWNDVPVTIINLDNAESLLQAEMDENVQRKGLTPYEAARARERRAQLLAPKAAARKGGRPKKSEETSPNLGAVKVPRKAREVSKVTSIGTGYSGSTLDKVDKIRDVAEKGMIKRGKNEIPAPAPVVEIAKKSLASVKETGAAIDGASRDLQEAVDTYIDAGSDVQRARRAKTIGKAINNVVAVTEYDAQEVAAVLDPDDITIYDAIFTEANTWWTQVKSCTTQGLRPIQTD